MSSELKTMQWNIGGAKLLREGDNPSLFSSYSEDGLEEVIEVLGQEDPDIITLQETHESTESSQPQSIAEALGYEHWVNDAWSESHIQVGQKLGQAVLSKTPITRHRAEPFINPLWQARWENGCYVTSHDKGLTTCEIDLDGKPLQVQNLHLIPFRLFDKDPMDDGRDILRDVETKIGDYKGPRLIQGDFNIDNPNMREFLWNLFTGSLRDVIQRDPTTPRGRKYDHVLYSGMTLVKSTVIKKDIRTDHYPIVTTFSI